MDASSLMPDPGADTDRITRGGVCSREESPFLPSCKLRRACCRELVRDTGALASPCESLQALSTVIQHHRLHPARKLQPAHRASLACDPENCSRCTHDTQWCSPH